MRDPDYKGEDYSIDPELQHGPLKNRRCTDCICLLVLIAACAAGVYVGYYASLHGNPELLVAPIDADGNFCGKNINGTNLTDYPYLYYDDINPETLWFPFAVCVKSCPLNNATPIPCNPTNNVKSCDNAATPRYDSFLLLDRWCLPVYSTLPDDLKKSYDNMIGDVGIDNLMTYAYDITRCWPLYLIGFGTVFVWVFMYNIALRLFAECLAYICIFGTGVGMIFLGWFIKEYAGETYPEGDTTRKYMEIMAYVLWFLTAVYACVVLCAWQSIQISIKILRTSAKVVSQNLRVILVPLLGIVVVFVWIIFFAYSMIWLFSCGDITTVTYSTDPLPGFGDITLFTYKKFAWSDNEKYMVYFSFFMFFWICAFIVASTDYVQIVAVASWYFSQDANNQNRGNYSICRGYWWMLRYNLGSLAFGSFLIACVIVIRLIFEYIEKKMKGVGDQGAMAAPVKCLMKCVRCCLDCCHRFVKYINKNAYCQVVLTGENFCTAAINGFLLILKHTVTFAFTGGVGAIFSFLGKCFISIINTLTIYGVLVNWEELYQKTNSPVGPMIITLLISYTISSLFMSIYTTTGLALMHCLFADIDIVSQGGGDPLEGTFRPPEMQGIVNSIAKPKENLRDSVIN